MRSRTVQSTRRSLEWVHGRGGSWVGCLVLGPVGTRRVVGSLNEGDGGVAVGVPGGRKRVNQKNGLRRKGESGGPCREG